MKKPSEGPNASRMLNASLIKNVDGKIIGKDGKPLRSVLRNTIVPNPMSNVNLNSEEGVNPGPSNVQQAEMFWGSSQTPNTSPKGETSSSLPQSSKPGSFADVLQNNGTKKVVKVKELRNSERVDGAAVAIPLDEVEAVCSRFANTLYGYFVGNRLAFPIVEYYVKNTWAKYGLKRIQLHEDFFMFQFNSKEGMEKVLVDGPWMIRREPLILNVWSQNTVLKKEEIRSVPVWVKLHHIPIVAYTEVGLSLISTQIGKPVTMDSYTSNMCANSWGRNTYARILIEVLAENELKKDMVVAIPIGKDKGHSLVTVSIEYEWTPPRCSTCLIFDHSSDKCPKLPKVAPVEPVSNDGFEGVTKRKNKNKKNKPKQVAGIVLNKPALNLHYRRVDKDAEMSGPTSTSSPSMIPTGTNVQDKGKSSSGISQDGKKGDGGKKKQVVVPNEVKVQNSFSSLDDETDWEADAMETTVINDSDSEDVDEELIMEGGNKPTGASTSEFSVPND